MKIVKLMLIISLPKMALKRYLLTKTNTIPIFYIYLKWVQIGALWMAVLSDQAMQVAWLDYAGYSPGCLA